MVETLPDMKYRIQLEDGSEIMAYTAGKMRIHRIRCMIGDRVEVELDPYKGKATNRLIRRL